MSNQSDVKSKIKVVKRPCMTSQSKSSILMYSHPHAHKTMFPSDATEQLFVPSLISRDTATAGLVRHGVVMKEDKHFIELEDNNLVLTHQGMPKVPGCNVSVIRYEAVLRGNPTKGEFSVEEGVGGGAVTRPSSSTSNFSELDSGFDELRATSVTPSFLVGDVTGSGGSHLGLNQLLPGEECRDTMSTALNVCEKEKKKYQTRQLECSATIEQFKPSCYLETSHGPQSDSSKSSGEELLSCLLLSPYAESDASLNYSHSDDSLDCVQPSYDYENNDHTQDFSDEQVEKYCQETVGYLNQGHDTHRVNSFIYDSLENSGEISVSHPVNVTGELLDRDDDDFDDIDTGGRRASLQVECYSSHGNMSTSPNTNGASHFEINDFRNQSKQFFVQRQTSFNLSNTSESQIIPDPSVQIPVRNASDHIQDCAMKGVEHERQFLWQPWNKSPVDVNPESENIFNPTVEQRHLSLQEVVHNTTELDNEEGGDRLGILRLRRECGVWKSEMSYGTRPAANSSLKVPSKIILATKPNEEYHNPILPANVLSIPHAQPLVTDPSENFFQFNESSYQKQFHMKKDFNLIPHSSELTPNVYHSESSLERVRGVPVILNQFDSHRFSSVEQSTPYRMHDQTAPNDVRQSWRNEHQYSEARSNTFSNNNCIFNHSQKMQYTSPGLLIPAIHEHRVPVPQSSNGLMTSLSTGHRGLNPFAVYLMSEWFDKNSSNPYPTAEVKADLANAGGISVAQLASWFNHRRTREKRKLHSSDGSGENGLGLKPINKRLKLDNDP